MTSAAAIDASAHRQVVDSADAEVAGQAGELDPVPAGVQAVSQRAQGIDNAEIIDTMQAGRAPMLPVSAALRL